MNFSDLFYRGAQPKPVRGSSLLERERQQEALRQHTLAIGKLVKKRDGRCRWPEAHKCRGGLEACHIVDKGMGGDHGLLTNTQNELVLCAWIHRRGPESLHGEQLKVEKETPAGADGPLSFWRKGEAGAFYLVARERAIGIVERD